MFDAKKFINEKSVELKEKIGDDTAIIGISGGVDSTTAATLVGHAVGTHLLCIFVDTGFMRKNEVAENLKILKGLGLNVILADEKERFYKALKGIIEPEDKRKTIGEAFIRIFEEIARKEGAKYFIQGTIAPDWIESGGGIRDTIKSHHNVGGLPEDIEFEIIEPLRDLYKDEVRILGKELGLPESVYSRQPFPGPGIAVRIVGEATKERAMIVREACYIVEEELKLATREKKMTEPWQYFAVLLPIKVVGVQGDIRAYKHIIVIRSVESLDGMSASYSKIPHEVLEKISIRITNELKDYVSRVVYDVTNKPPGTIEYE